MKFVPNAAFERINSLLAGVDALGCKSTVRVEAFSCKKGKEDWKTQQQIATNSGGNNGSSNNNSNDGGMGFPATSFNSSDGADGEQQESEASYTQDERFLWLVSALNTIYGDDYDFSILAPHHFNLVDAFGAMAEVDQILTAVPESIIGANPHNSFWGTLNEQIVQGGGTLAPQPQQQQGGFSPSPSLASECEFFKFVCPECDPAAQEKLWSCHYFIYSKKMKLMVSLLCYGEGNVYRGDEQGGWGAGNGGQGGNNGFSTMNPTGSPTGMGPAGTDSPMYYYDRDNGQAAFPSAPSYSQNNNGGRGNWSGSQGAGGAAGFGSSNNLVAMEEDDLAGGGNNTNFGAAGKNQGYSFGQ